MTTADKTLPIVWRGMSLPPAGRIVVLVISAYCLFSTGWMWFTDHYFSWKSLLFCLLWLGVAMIAPVERRTIVDETGIIWETRWPWGVRRRLCPLSDLSDVRIEERNARQPGLHTYYVLSCRVKSGDWRYLTNYDYQDEAVDMAQFLRQLAQI